MDKVVLGKGIYLEDEIGAFRPNNNQVVVGCSGTGKSMSVMLPTILNMDESSIIATYSKPREARKIGKYLEEKGYNVRICDLSDPAGSNVSFEPLDYVSSQLDISELAAEIVLADPRGAVANDRYWDDGATALLESLIDAEILYSPEPKMSEVIKKFNELKLKNVGTTDGTMSTSLDGYFNILRMTDPDSQAVLKFRDFQHLPYRTAACIRDALAKPLRKMFPPDIVERMENCESIDFWKMAETKTALLIITSPVNTSLYFFANLIFGTAIKQLLEYASKCPDGRLPRPVRLMFDDFACAAPIKDFSKHISIFRAAGISAMLLIQSESQLNSIYSRDEATTILNNCSAYVYFSGGMDLETCINISRRLDVPMTEVLYAPSGNVIILRSGKKPVTVPRYDIFGSDEYRIFKESTEDNEGAR